LPLHAYLLGDEIETMAQSSTRGICFVPAVWLGVQAGVIMPWMLEHPVADAIMAADTSINRHELNRFVLPIVSSFRCSKFSRPYRRHDRILEASRRESSPSRRLSLVITQPQRNGTPPSFQRTKIGNRTHGPPPASPGSRCVHFPTRRGTLAHDCYRSVRRISPVVEKELHCGVLEVAWGLSERGRRW
jgi:hypothetical protein